jgi:serine/threonine protein kinase
MLSTRDETEDVVVKIGDFGLSTFLEDERAPSTYAGTKEYLAPVSSRRLIELARSSITKFKEQEINRYREGKNHWTKACDVFSLGCE